MSKSQAKRVEAMREDAIAKAAEMASYLDGSEAKQVVRLLIDAAPQLSLRVLTDYWGELYGGVVREPFKTRFRCSECGKPVGDPDTVHIDCANKVSSWGR